MLLLLPWPHYVFDTSICFNTWFVFSPQKLSKRYVLKRNQRKRQREEDLKKEEKKSLEKRPKTAHEAITESADSPEGDVKMTKEGEEKMSTDRSASVHDEQSKEGQVKLGTDHPISNHDEPAKEGGEKMNSHSEAALKEAEAGTKMDEEDPEYEEDPEEIEIYEDDEDMDDAHAEEPTAELVLLYFLIIFLQNMLSQLFMIVNCNVIYHRLFS